MLLPTSNAERGPLVAPRPTRSPQPCACCEALEERVVLSAAPGSLDLSFGGGNGVVQVSLGGAFGQANAVTALPGGKVVLVGRSESTGNFADNRFAVARLNADGSLDKSFGHGTGVVTTRFTAGSNDAGGDDADAVAVLPGGKLLVAGQAAGGSAGFAVARYNPDGSPDKSFGSAGVVVTPFGGTDNVTAIALMADGRFVLAGTDQFDAGGGKTGAVRGRPLQRQRLARQDLRHWREGHHRLRRSF